MRAHAPELDAAAQLAAIGTGDIAYARDFKARMRVGFPVLVDDDLASYDAVAAETGALGALAKPTVLAKGARAVLRGARQGRTGPAPLRLGATHVVHPDGAVTFAWRNADYADSAPPAAVLAALGQPA